ncbi:MAG TPA: myxococcus cysteine-rich repeat containing protein, partial [Kofleriaceae bacterium]|nr:myxococcus cysteine-rich repeat containing protein [Kofleriaceae bacterium]
MRVSLASALALSVVSLIGAAGCLGVSSSRQAGGDDDDAVTPCAFTQGYWKNHPDAWPVSSLSLGGHVYTEAELLAIFDEAPAGNGLISLAHQLIAAKLNVAAGAPDDDIADTIAEADALIGDLVVPPIGDGFLDPADTSALNDALTAFNESGDEVTCVPTQPVCGDGTVDEGEQCDDGNTVDGDGCSANCTTETPPPPACGDGTVDEGEQCDDS